MRNELFTIGPFTVYGYGLMIAIGAFAAYLLSEYRAKKIGLKHDLIFALFWWCLGGGILGAKILYILTQLKEITADPSILLNISEGFVIYGGIIGGILGGFLFCRLKKLEFLKYFDLVMPSIALAQGFGRVGCVFAGCCYGNNTDSFFHIIFHESKFAPNDIALIPTQPLSSGLNFLNFAVLIFLSKRVKADGQLAGFYLIFYSAGRFILEFLRGDLVRGHIGILSTSQFIAVFLFIFGIALVVFCGKNPRLQKSSVSADKESPLNDKTEKDLSKDKE